MSLNSKVHEYSLFELTETQRRIEYLTKLKIDSIYMNEVKSEVDKELKEQIDKYILLYAYNKLYNERSDIENTLKKYIIGDIEEKLIEKILYAKDNKNIDNKDNSYNEILFKLINNDSIKDKNIDKIYTNDMLNIDDTKSKIEKYEAIKNNSLNNYQNINLSNKKQDDVLKQTMLNQNTDKKEYSETSSQIITPNIKTDTQKVKIENQQIETNNNIINTREETDKNPTLKPEDIKQPETTGNNPSIVIIPRNDLESHIYLLPIIVGIILLVDGVFLISSFFFLPSSMQEIPETIRILISYLSFFPGFFIPLSSLSGLSLTTLGLILGLMGFNILLLGASIWKKVKFSNFIGSIVFIIAALLSLTSIIISGLSNTPFALISLVLNGITSYLLYKRSKTNP